MDKAGTDARNLVVNGLQSGQQLLDAKVAQGVDAVGVALKSRQVQGHGRGGLLVDSVGGKVGGSGQAGGV